MVGNTSVLESPTADSIGKIVQLHIELMPRTKNKGVFRTPPSDSAELFIVRNALTEYTSPKGFINMDEFSNCIYLHTSQELTDKLISDFPNLPIAERVAYVTSGIGEVYRNPRF